MLKIIIVYIKKDIKRSGDTAKAEKMTGAISKINYTHLATILTAIVIL